MSRNASIPILGLDHASYANPRLCALLSTTELGALVRLIQFSWYEVPPCTLPSAPAALAQIAGLAEGEWALIEGRLLGALGAVDFTLPEGTPSLSLTIARELYDREAAKRRAALQQRATARAGRAASRERALSGPDPGQNWARTGPENRGSGVASGVSSRPRTREALERSNSYIQQKRSSAQHPATSIETADPLDRSAIAGAIYDGLEAAAEAKVRIWRATQARELLKAACVAWASKGMLKDAQGRVRDDWQDDVARIASVPHVTPAAMELAIGRCNVAASQAPAGTFTKALGYVIRALGAFRGGKPLEPYLTDQPVVDRWAAIERKLFDASKALAAAEGAATRFDDARKRLSPPTPTHPNAGNVAGASGA